MSKSVSFAALMAAAALSCGAANAEPLFAFLAPPLKRRSHRKLSNPRPRTNPMTRRSIRG